MNCHFNITYQYSIVDVSDVNLAFIWHYSLTNDLHKLQSDHKFFIKKKEEKEEEEEEEEEKEEDELYLMYSTKRNSIKN